MSVGGRSTAGERQKLGLERSVGGVGHWLHCVHWKVLEIQLTAEINEEHPELCFGCQVQGERLYS